MIFENNQGLGLIKAVLLVQSTTVVDNGLREYTFPSAIHLYILSSG